MHGAGSDMGFGVSEAETCPWVMEQGVKGSAAWRNTTWGTKPVPCIEEAAIDSNQAEGSLQDHSTTGFIRAALPADRKSVV